MNRRLPACLIVLLLPLTARAGLYLSSETVAPLPAKWSGFLVDHRSLRTLSVAPAKGLPPSPLQSEYRQRLTELEAKSNRTADDVADLGALYIRLGKASKAVELLRIGHRDHPKHFHIAANLGTAWQVFGELPSAADSLARAVKLAPAKLKAVEELHLKLVRIRSRQANGDSSLDDLFGVPFVGPEGQWTPGGISSQNRAKLPTEALAHLQQLALWLPSDARLLWQLGELANAGGDVRTAAALFDGLATEFAMSTPIIRDRRQKLRATADKLPPSRRGADPTHDERISWTFRSNRALVRRFDASLLPEPSAERGNPLPWAILADTSIDGRFRPTFPSYVSKVGGKPVSLTGFMQPLGDANEVSAFLLLEYPVGCWFCESPGPTSVIFVELPSGKAMMLRRGLVKVEGKFILNATDPEDFVFTIRDAAVGEPD